jgi:asparagine synthase (glutamine-hydrolysing)
VYSSEAGAVDREIVREMRDCIAHRGPDDAGLFLDENAALGHRRLSVIDLAGGHQPMCDSSGSVWIVFNGEIYNFLDLRARLVDEGYEFKTNSDTEVMLALYNRDGEDFVEHLNGIFALAMWDARERKLLLVRDRLGVKPLYFWRRGHTVAAASEIKALLCHPEIDAEVNYEAIPEYLAFRQLAVGATLFKGIETVEPGQIVRVRDGQLTARSYWQLPECRASNGIGVGEWVGRLDELLRDATVLQLIADVPLGTFASGGVDSSLVTSYAAEKSSERLNTFCIGIENPDFDERSYSELVARQVDSHHRIFLARGQEMADELPRVVWHHDEPLTHPNILPIYFLSRLAKQHVTVVLTGEGCDEFFGGYPRYRIGAVMQRLGPLGRRLARLVGGLMPPPRPTTRLGKMMGALRADETRAVADLSRYVSDVQLRDLLAGEFKAISPARNGSSHSDMDIVSQMLSHDQRNYLLPILLRLDKASMASGLEARVPFLDHRVVEFAATVPTSLKVTPDETKRLVKKVARRRLPKRVVDRRKSGLALPLAEWMRQPRSLGRYLDMLLEPRSRQRGYLDGERLSQIIAEHRSEEADHAEILWGLLNLEVWQREMVDGAAAGKGRASARPAAPARAG